jgi:hypothetical protein
VPCVKHIEKKDLNELREKNDFNRLVYSVFTEGERSSGTRSKRI